MSAGTPRALRRRRRLKNSPPGFKNDGVKSFLGSNVREGSPGSIELQRHPERFRLNHDIALQRSLLLLR
jgi:hypothetical protein